MVACRKIDGIPVSELVQIHVLLLVVSQFTKGENLVEHFIDFPTKKWKKSTMQLNPDAEIVSQADSAHQNSEFITLERHS